MLKNFISLFYPKLCAGCNDALRKNEDVICVMCMATLPYTTDYLTQENKTAQLFWGKVPLVHAITAFHFNKQGKIQRLIHELKYQGNVKVGEVLGKELGKSWMKMENSFKVDLIIPVPLHPKRKKQRGYNQSSFIANGMAEFLQGKVDEKLLIRTVYSGSQTKKTKYNRWENVQGIFKVTDPKALENKHVLLIDDVITTGSTLDSCCHALKDIKNIKISIGALALAQ